VICNYRIAHVDEEDCEKLGELELLLFESCHCVDEVYNILSSKRLLQGLMASEF
jgi:hypothetical protein